ncbi:MAG: mechanosensitive ion channel [Niabella sp.]|nr:mechanosensitive ion channel [Niabella sp.]
MIAVPRFHLVKRYLVCVILLACISSLVQAQTAPRTPQNTQSAAVLADTNVVSNADYLEGLQKVYEALNKVPVVTSSFTHIPDIEAELTDNDSAIYLIKQRLSFKTRAHDLQNLQMYRALLYELTENNSDNKTIVAGYDTSLVAVKKEILGLRKDSLILKVFRTPALRDSFSAQVADIKTKWKVADSLLSLNTTLVNTLKARAAAAALALQESLYQTNAQLKSAGPRAFQKDRDYIWQGSGVSKKKYANRAQLLNNEEQIVHYYFKNTRSDRLVLLMAALLFFLWVVYSFHGLSRSGKLSTLDELHLEFVSSKPVWPALTLLFTLAPAFELDAPVFYTDLLQILLAASLSKFFYKRVPKDAFKLWLAFVVLLLMVPLFHMLFTSFSSQRWLILLVNAGSIGLGLVVLKRYRSFYPNFKLSYSALVVYVLLNTGAILSNIFGRGALTQLFFSTASFQLLYAIGLTVAVQSIREAFLVHIKNCRARKGYADHFEWQDISADISRVLSFLALFLWLMLLGDSLDLLDPISESLGAFLSQPRKLGGFSITFSGVLLCIGIIWLANFLQKYIAYFFGETGEDAIEHVNAQHSRLLITRLVLLITGFFLAVAASGLPIDKITVIIGALSVGIGLGLQSIVNNFISGIILIFDRTIRVGDVVELSSRKGKVKEIGIRSSTLVSDEGADIIIPNGDILSHNIINWTLSNNIVRSSVTIIVAKAADIETLSDAVREAVIATKGVAAAKPPAIYLSPISAKWSTLKVFFWSDLSGATSTKNRVTETIYEKLKELEIATPE